MSNEPDASKERPAKRGEAAWKEVREATAARNDQARRDARERREEGEKMRLAARKTIHERRRRMATGK